MKKPKLLILDEQQVNAIKLGLNALLNTERFDGESDTTEIYDSIKSIKLALLDDETEVDNTLRFIIKSDDTLSVTNRVPGTGDKIESTEIGISGVNKIELITG
jgi:hypothetical protein